MNCKDCKHCQQGICLNKWSEDYGLPVYPFESCPAALAPIEQEDEIENISCM